MGTLFCLALKLSARYVCGFPTDIGVLPDGRPMDFHACFEAFSGGEWRTFGARRNTPRVGRVVIADGRDALDTAFLPVYGNAELSQPKVWADKVPEGDGLLA